MIVDGKKIAEELYAKISAEIGECSCTPILTIITCAPNFETKKYLALKEKKAKAVGIATNIIELNPTSTTQDFVDAINGAVGDSDGIIVQLPLPPTADLAIVAESIPVTHDVDALNPKNSKLLSPVVGAIREILGRYSIRIPDTFVTVIGSGRLVGLPAYHWFIGQCAHVSVVTKDTEEIEHYTKNADIIVCGAGVPGLITPSHVKDGVIILDAGTSEQGGELRGDVDPACADKALLFTPVPGGIGPITIAILLSNVVTCAIKKTVVL